MKNFKGQMKNFAWTLMWAMLLLRSSATEPQNNTEDKLIEVQIVRTILMSTEAPEKVTGPQEAKGTNLQVAGAPTFSVTTGVIEHVAALLGNETIASTGSSYFPEAPVISSITQSPNLPSLNNTTIATFLLDNTSVTLSPFPILPVNVSTTRASINLEINEAHKLAENNSLIPALRLTENHTVSLATNSSQSISNATTAIKSSQRKSSSLKPVRKKTAASVPKLSRNDTVTEHRRLVGGKNATKLIAKPPKQRKVTKPTKQPKKPEKQRSSKLKLKTKKPKARVKPVRTKKQQKVKKKKNTQTDESRVETTSFPYFEDYYCPPQCACYGRIVQCSDKGLDKIPYGIPFNTRNLFLMNNKIDVIPLDLLNEYMLLEFLVLNNNKLTDIGVEGTLEGMQKLTRLYMDQNNLSSIPTDLPSTLEELMLNSNNISMMSSQVWAKCKNLKTISLNNNRITDESIPPGAFNPVQNLHVIKMNHNLLTAVPADFSTSLRELFLEGNQIRKLPDNVFTDSSALIYLNLHNNQLNNKGIGKKAFLHMSKLEYLDLGKNALTVIPKLLPRSLKKLILQANSITSVRKDAFQNMLKLEEIYLAHNQISLVAIGAFKGLAGLRHLDLSHNRLAQVPRQLPLTLQYLYLHSNQIDYIPRDALCGHQWAESHLILVRLEKNILDHRQADVHALQCLRGYQVIHFE
ncbi:wu:fc23c09 [Heptranchias perlo]|uniref:wu:fc23c09 n=1 Tax=Heptranchias perlo TaxID=212740 RepID=UPI003559A97A